MLEFLEIDECISPPLTCTPGPGWQVQHVPVDGRRKVKWLKIMSVQHLDGRRKGKMVENHVSPTSVGRRRREMVENHVSPTSRWKEEGGNG